MSVRVASSSWLSWSQYSSSLPSLRLSPGSEPRFFRNLFVNLSLLFHTAHPFPQFCSSYLRLFHSKLIARQRELKTTTWSTKTQLMATSAQDHFAKWAKLKRSVDKGFQDLETTSESPRLIHEASLKLTTTCYRFRNCIGQDPVQHQVQIHPLVHDHWSSIFHRLVV